MDFLVPLMLLGMMALTAMMLGLRGRIELLEQRLEAGPAGLAPDTSPAEPVPEPAAAAAAAIAVPAAPVREIVLDIEPEAAPGRETLGALFERLVAGRLLIWLGGVALV